MLHLKVTNYTWCSFHDNAVCGIFVLEVVLVLTVRCVETMKPKANK
jgi:hypothetical protein